MCELVGDQAERMVGWAKSVHTVHGRGRGASTMVAMVLEQAVLEVVPGQEPAFEEAFAKAKEIISSAAGFRSLRLGRCLEEPNRYVLLVEWERLEDHTDGFRGSAAYQEWRRLLHHFYDPFPRVDHYEDRVVVR